MSLQQYVHISLNQLNNKLHGEESFLISQQFHS